MIWVRSQNSQTGTALLMPRKWLWHPNASGADCAVLSDHCIVRGTRTQRPGRDRSDNAVRLTPSIQGFAVVLLLASVYSSAVHVLILKCREHYYGVNETHIWG